ncbi:hypothetical protein LINPERHAP2_LOCUS33038 [Linum perenne]
MRILCWNFIGIRSPRIVNYLNDLIRTFSPSIIFLSETRNSREVVEKRRRQAKFPKFWYQDPIGSSGDLALWWAGSINLNVLGYNFFFVDISIIRTSYFFLSLVHAPNDPYVRANF